MDMQYNFDKCFVEVWENQRYWPINGWEGQKGLQFSNLLFENASDKFPNIELPPGWEWIDDWEVDNTKRYGNTDADGYMYASTNEKLVESIRNRNTVGTASNTSIVRRRVMVRGKRCVNEKLKAELRILIESYKKQKSILEGSLSDKRAEMQAVVEFDDEKCIAFDAVTDRCAELLDNTTDNIRFVLSKLYTLKQFLTERTALEREYTKKLHGLASKFDKIEMENSQIFSHRNRNAVFGSAAVEDGSSLKTSAEEEKLEHFSNSAADEESSPDLDQDSDDEYVESIKTDATDRGVGDDHTDSCNTISELDTKTPDSDAHLPKLLHELGKWVGYSADMSPVHGNNPNSGYRRCSGVGDKAPSSMRAASLFIKGFGAVTCAIAERTKHYSQLLSDGMLMDVNGLIDYLQEILKFHAIDRKRISEAYRVSHENSKNSSKHVGLSFDYQVKSGLAGAAALHELIKYTAEQGGNIVWTRVDGVKATPKSSADAHAPMMNIYGKYIDNENSGDACNSNGRTDNCEDVASVSAPTVESRAKGNTNNTTTVTAPASKRFSMGSLNNLRSSIGSLSFTASSNLSVKGKPGAETGNEVKEEVGSWTNDDVGNRGDMKETTTTTTDSSTSQTSIATSGTSRMFGSFASAAGKFANSVTTSVSASVSSMNRSVVEGMEGLKDGAERSGSSSSTGEEVSGMGSINIGANHYANNRGNKFLDYWLSVQLYRQSIVSQTETLQDLISFSRSYFLLSGTIADNVRHMFIAAMKLVTHEQSRIWEDCADSLEEICDSVVNNGVLSHPYIPNSSDQSHAKKTGIMGLTLGMSSLMSNGFSDDEDDGSERSSETNSPMKSCSSGVNVTPNRMLSNSHLSPIPNLSPTRHSIVGTATPSTSSAIHSYHKNTKDVDSDDIMVMTMQKRPLSAKAVDYWLSDALGMKYMPNSVAVSMHGVMDIASSNVLMNLFDNEDIAKAWVPHHITITMDGYIHVCKMGPSGQPLLPPVVTYECNRCDFAHGCSGNGPILHSIDIRTSSKRNSSRTGAGLGVGAALGLGGIYQNTMNNWSSPSSALAAAASFASSITGGDTSSDTAIVLRTGDASEAYAWVTVLTNPLASCMLPISSTTDSQNTNSKTGADAANDAANEKPAPAPPPVNTKSGEVSVNNSVQEEAVTAEGDKLPAASEDKLLAQSMPEGKPTARMDKEDASVVVGADCHATKSGAPSSAAAPKSLIVEGPSATDNSCTSSDATPTAASASTEMSEESVNAIIQNLKNKTRENIVTFDEVSSNSEGASGGADDEVKGGTNADPGPVSKIKRSDTSWMKKSRSDADPDAGTNSDNSWMKPDSFSNAMANSTFTSTARFGATATNSTNRVKYGYQAKEEAPVAVRRSVKIDAYEQGLRASFSQGNSVLSQTREKTLEEFRCSKQPTMVKQLSQAFDDSGQSDTVIKGTAKAAKLEKLEKIPEKGRKLKSDTSAVSPLDNPTVDI